jgi:ANTAR domain-containing protein/GAF domain-containing protein
VGTASASPALSLVDSLIRLAGTPDDDSAVPARLRSITQLAADLLSPVRYASMTVRGDDSFTTVAMSSLIAREVDQAQYLDDAGPCLDALRTGAPVAARRFDATVPWPRFRETAYRLGLRASMSIPLFAGRGTPLAALNLYGTDEAAMAPLSAKVVAIYEASPGSGPEVAGAEVGAAPMPEANGPEGGAVQLVKGLAGAFAVRAQIQQAIGVIMAEKHTNADSAYVTLRSRAAGTGLSLTAAASAVLLRTGDEPRPA